MIHPRNERVVVKASKWKTMGTPSITKQGLKTIEPNLGHNFGSLLEY